MPARTVSIEIPDIDTMPDADIAAMVRLRDGKWSGQTKALLAHFETNLLDLNSLWAAEWVEWACPCCRRTKWDIARVANGVLLCKLVTHHDHAADRARKIFAEANPKVEDGDPLNGQIIDMKAYLTPLVERFGPLVVCADCNEAEGAAKVQLRGTVDPDFTFTPEEVAQFIGVAAHQSHEVDSGRARDLWFAAREDFEDRLDFARYVAGRFASGRHRRKPNRVRSDVFEDANFVMGQVRTKLPDLRRRTLATMLDVRSTSNDGAARSSRPKAKSPPVAPTPEEIAAFVAAMPQGRREWAAAGDDWRCPCCHRSKPEIFRKSNKGRWTAFIHSVRDFEDEPDRDSLAFRRQASTSPIVLGSYVVVLICQDCFDVGKKVRTRASGALHEECLRPADIESILTGVEPNRAHDFDMDRGLRTAEGNRDLVAAIEDFGAHRDLTRHAAAEYFRLTKLCDMSPAEAMDGLALQYVEDDDDGGDWDWACDYAAWLLDEEARLKEVGAAADLPKLD